MTIKKQQDPEAVRSIAERLLAALDTDDARKKRMEDDAVPECKLCGGLGFMEIKRAAPKNYGPQMSECECAIERRAILRLPLIYRSADLLDLSKAKQEGILNWFKRPSIGLVLTGKPGRGKTYAAAAIVKTLLLVRQDAYFVRNFDFLATVRASYREERGESEYFDSLNEHRFLVLDDAACGGLSDFERRIINEFLDLRANAGLHTIVTTNFSLEEIAAKVDDRLASRLQAYEWFLFEGKDWRANG